MSHDKIISDLAEKMKSPPDKIIVELTRTGTLMRMRCTVCGGMTTRSSVGAKGIVRLDDESSMTVRVCECCIGDLDALGTIDERLEYHAGRLEAQAEIIRSLIGRMEVPTYEEWEEAEIAIDREPPGELDPENPF